MSNPNGWQHAVLYQIYPRSFLDTQHDGVGDLPGIISKLDYIQSLGVDAVWISPFFPSPMKDMGYDVSEYCDVDPLFGTLDDFKILLKAAHERGIKVLIDQVLNHTSDQHAWFLESEKNQTNPKAGWYVWENAKADGAPPNNWLSVFGGSAWAWHEGRQQYYLHNFLTSQPDLNFYCDAVVEAVLQSMRFWLDLGVDGFRLDAVNFYLHDAALRDNPPREKGVPTAPGAPPENPYAHYYHRYDKTQPGNLALLEKIRELMNEYPGTVTIGELGDDDFLKTTALYCNGSKRLHATYNFALLEAPLNAAYFREQIAAIEKALPDGVPCWSFSNHDVKRVVSRWCDDVMRESDCAKMLISLLLSLRGMLCFYQGEELGLTEVDIPREKIQDPYGIAMWPAFKGRDGCRTPMPWKKSAKYAGFSDVEPWLPLGEDHSDRAVDCQEDDPQSVLNHFRRAMRFRQKHSALLKGDIQFLDAPDNMLAFKRQARSETLLCLFNLSAQSQSFDLAAYKNYHVVADQSFAYDVGTQTITLEAYGFLFVKLAE